MDLLYDVRVDAVHENMHHERFFVSEGVPTMCWWYMVRGGGGSNAFLVMQYC